ncbi:hypothetical protein [Microscilla marina]|uniref:Lipoprotein, putative n=1 Tax=Microscilla marina ATCC 23134 TaxID=313606 RepID=A1ZM44_MICM2|nr:hypothetical protein [Microscilla marina]EAY28576.1 lipoprotein, putative [Microscilla marina ATCC 23134]
MESKRLLLIICLLLSGLYACSNQNQEDDVVPSQPDIAIPQGPSCPNSPSVIVKSTQNTECGQSQGKLVVEGSGGQGSLTYSINGQNFQTDTVFAGLADDTYTVIVKDSIGCTNTVNASIGTNSDVSLITDVEPIIRTNCAISQCHVSGGRSPNLTTKASILNNAASIKSEVVSGSMPRGSTLSKSEIDQIRCWVNDGAKDN